MTGYILPILFLHFEKLHQKSLSSGIQTPCDRFKNYVAPRLFNPLLDFDILVKYFSSCLIYHVLSLSINYTGHKTKMIVPKVIGH